MIEKYRELLVLAVKLRDLAREGNLADFERVIAERERLIRQLSDYSLQVSPVEESRVREILACVNQIDLETQQLLCRQRDETSTELISLSSRKKALSAYRKNIYRARNFDRFK